MSFGSTSDFNGLPFRLELIYARFVIMQSLEIEFFSLLERLMPNPLTSCVSQANQLISFSEAVIGFIECRLGVGPRVVLLARSQLLEDFSRGFIQVSGSLVVLPCLRI